MEIRARSGGEWRPDATPGTAVRVVWELSHHPFAHTRLVERGGALWVEKRFRAPRPLGRVLAPATRALMRHELENCRRLEGVEGVASRVEPLDRDAFLREWVEGVDLKAHSRRGGGLPDGFFDELWEILGRIHASGMSYNDLEKKDNVLVTPAGRPVLIDFQISLRPYLGRSRLVASVSGWAIRELQRQDVRYFCKMKQRFRPDLVTPFERDRVARRSGLSRAYHPLWRVLHGLKRLLIPKGSSRYRFSRREPPC